MISIMQSVRFSMIQYSGAPFENISSIYFM